MPAISSFSYLPNMEFVKVTLYNLYMKEGGHFMMYVILGVFWLHDEYPKDENPNCPSLNRNLTLNLTITLTLPLTLTLTLTLNVLRHKSRWGFSDSGYSSRSPY